MTHFINPTLNGISACGQETEETTGVLADVDCEACTQWVSGVHEAGMEIAGEET